jgi:hypothetical protein
MTRAGCNARRAALGVGLAALAGCSAGEGAQCIDGFCLPADVVIVGSEQQADFTGYQLTWRGEAIGLTASDYPNFDVKRAVPYAVPLDPDARLIAGGGTADVRIRLGEASPRYLHLAGQCEDIATCNLGALAKAITREGQ